MQVLSSIIAPGSAKRITTNKGLHTVIQTDWIAVMIDNVCTELYMYHSTEGNRFVMYKGKNYLVDVL